MKRPILITLIASLCHALIVAQAGADDYWMNNGFANGDTVYTNSGWFYDDGGNGVYQEGQNWNVTFCSENGSPLTIDFSNFRTHFGGTIGVDSYTNYDYITVDYPGASYVVYHDNTPEFSFTSQSTCITVGFISDADGQVDSGWVAEIYALPAPFNNDPANAEELVVGNICSPSFYSNKGAFNTTSLGSPPCQTYYGGDVWFRSEVPASGMLKIETFAGSLDYAILDIFNSPDANLLPSERIACVDDAGAMPSVILSAPLVVPGDVVYIRLFGEQAKSGLFGICASDPAAPVTGFTGPGGVGDSVSLDYWFLPESGILNNSGVAASGNDPVRTWEDQSGNGQHLVQNNSAYQPLYVAGAAGNYGALEFDGTNDLFELASGSGDAPLHWFVTGNFQGNQRQTMVSIGDVFPDKTASLSRDTDDRYFSFTDVDLSGPPLAEGQHYIFNAAHTNTAPFHHLEMNGLPQTVDPELLPLETNGTFRMGASWEGAEPLSGQISELIQYRKTLNRAQEIIVNNYLSAKYNIPLDENDVYPFKTTFPYDVAGIGRIDANNTHTKAMSAGFLSVSGADDFDDNEFLLFGHDNGDATSWSSTGIPAGDTNIVRLERMWRIGLTGSPGEVTMGLQKDLLPALPDGFVAYNILVDADGDFSSGASSYGPYDLNSELVINNLAVSHGDYITVAAVRPVISFVSDATASFESVHNPVMEIALNYPVSTPVEVNYAVTGGTAVQGDDFSLVPSAILINPGSRSGNIVPLVLDDDVAEIPDEYFDVQISTSTTGVLAGGITTSRHTILNDDLEVGILAADTVIGACDASQAVLVADAWGTGPFTFAWTPSGGLNTAASDTVIANPDVTTSYTVEVTDSFGLTKRAGITVHVVPPPAQPAVTTNGLTAFCQGNSVGLAAPEGHVAYLWSTGEDAREITVNSAGNYNVVVTDSFGCDSPVSADIVVTVHPLPDPPEITADGPMEFCDGGMVTLIAGGDFVSYTWNDDVTGKERLVEETAVFAVFVEDANGCLSGYSDSVEITKWSLPAQPVITPPGPLTLFMGESIQLTSSEATAYQWSPGGETTRSIDVSAAGDYSVMVENESGCQGPSSEIVTVMMSEFLPPPEIDVVGELSFCDGEGVTLTGPEGFSTYTWSDGATGRENSVTTEAAITLVVTDENGTQSQPSEALLITVYELPELSLQERVIPLCHDDQNGSITVTANGGTVPYSYSWIGRDEASATISSLSAGTYGVLVEDNHGCMDTLEIQLSEPDPLEVDDEVTAAYCPDFSDGYAELTAITGGTPPYYVSWTGGETTEYLQDLSPGTYDYSVTDANGCAVDGRVVVDFRNTACFIVPGIITPNQDGYNDYWRIEGLEVYPEVTIEIFNRWGRRIFYSEGHSTYFDGTFDGKELPMESYHYVIDLHNGSERIIGNITIIR